MIGLSSYVASMASFVVGEQWINIYRQVQLFCQGDDDDDDDDDNFRGFWEQELASKKSFTLKHF